MANEFKEQFQEAIKFNNQQKSNTQIENSKKETSLLYPTAQEKRYKVNINKEIIKPLIQEVNQTLRDNYLNWVREINIDVSIKQDQYVDELDQLIRRLLGIQNDIFGNPTDDPQNTIAWGVIITAGLSIFLFNERQFNKATKRVTGFNFTLPKDWQDDVIKEWSNNNYILLRSYTTDYIKEVNRIVSDGIKNSDTWKTTSEKINKKVSG